MAFHKKTINDIDIAGKWVLLRADYNVPLAINGKIASDYRIVQSLPTIKALTEKNCKVIICSHLGRPKNSEEKSLSLRQVADKLGDLLGQHVAFVDDCIGDKVSKAVEELDHGRVLLLENLRFHKEEEQNNEKFAKEILESTKADVFVQDGFGVVHRAHASTEAITHLVTSVAGLLLQREVDTITEVMQNPKRPLMAIVGGAKIADKIDILNKFIDLADFVAVGGAMSNTFLMARGTKVGKSMTDVSELDEATAIMKKAQKAAKERGFVMYLPQDGVVAKTQTKNSKTRIVDWGANVIADIENYPKRPPRRASHIADDEMLLDIGPFSGAFIAGAMQQVSTVVWNGAMGVTEIPSVNGPIGPFANGTELIIDALLGEFGHKPFSLVGGGDTSAYLEGRNISSLFNHVSTGGGASLELMAGKKLPGIEALQGKH